MLLSFRQGLVQTQASPSFLSKIGNNIRLNCDSTPFIGTFAHGNHDYLLVESETIAAAWTGSFPNTSNYYLYIDIDIPTGVRTFGYTTVAPTYGSSAPPSPVADHHFFNLKTKIMQVKVGNRWVDKIRLFVGYLQSGTILNVYTIGSTVNLNQSNYSGQILYDDAGKPVKRLDKFNSGAFLTTESFISYQNALEQSTKAEGYAITAKAVETIPTNYCVCYKDYNKLGVASSTDITHPCVGISLASHSNGEVVRFIKFGKISNPNSWNWLDPPMTSVFVGRNGEITTTVPNDYSMQKIGYVVDSSSIFVDITDQILINK